MADLVGCVPRPVFGCSAPEGIDHIELEALPWEEGFFSVSKANHRAYTRDDYESEYGGGSSMAYWRVRAYDNNGDVATVSQQSWDLNVFQEDGRGPGGRTASVIYSGSWTPVECLCFSGGGWESTGPDTAVYHKPQTRYATAKNAAVGFTYSFQRGDHVGVVMPTSANRGKANIVIDGTITATVNTYSPSTKNRVVVWQKWMPEGIHTVKVVNLATPGHPRIDIDAFLLNS